MEKKDGAKKQPSGCGLFVSYKKLLRGRRKGRKKSTSRATPDAKPHHPSALPVASCQPNPGTAAAVVAPPYNHHQAPVAGVKAKAAALNRKIIFAAGRKAPQQYCGTAIAIAAAELDAMIHDHQRTNGSSKLIRASSGNVMLFGNLGNIRAPVAIARARNLIDGSPESAKELTNGSAPPDHGRQLAANGSEAEKLKEMGNEEYEKGRLAEAVALFEKATLIDPDKALYRSNKAAALVAMGRLLEAVGDCREAVKIDPSFCRGHQQLANLYLR